MRVSATSARTEFLLAKEVDGRSAQTIVGYRASTDRLIDYLTTVEGRGPVVDDLTVPNLRGFIYSLQQNPDMKPVSVAKVVREVKVFVNWCSANGYIGPTPFRRNVLQVPTFKEEMKDYVSPEDFSALLGACNVRTHAGRRNYAILAFLYDTGVRVGELVNIRAEDVVVQQGMAKVLGKGRRERFVFFGPEVQRAILRYRSRLDAVVKTEYLFVSDASTKLLAPSINQMIRRVALRAGVKGHINPHSFRHAFGHNYLMAGGDTRDLQMLMGHSQITTTTKYLSLSTEDLRSRHAQFSPMANRKTK